MKKTLEIEYHKMIKDYGDIISSMHIIQRKIYKYVKSTNNIRRLKHGKVQILFNEYDEIDVKGSVLEGSAPFKEIEVNDIKIIRKLCDLLKIYADIGSSPQGVYQVGEGDSAISYVTYFIMFDRQGFVMDQKPGTYKDEVIALLRNILGEEMNIITSKDEEKIVDIMISHAEY